MQLTVLERVIHVLRQGAYHAHKRLAKLETELIVKRFPELVEPDADRDDIAHWNKFLDGLKHQGAVNRAAGGAEIHYKVNLLLERRPDLAVPLRALRRRVLIESLGMSEEMADKRLDKEEVQ